jgi:hypothetical protein
MSGFAFRLAFVPILFAGLLAGAWSQVSEYPKVNGFSAYLLNSHTGQLSGDMIGHDEKLGNVPAGPFSSVSTLVVVHVALDPKGMMRGQVRLAVTAHRRGAARRVLLDRVSRLGPVAEDGMTHVGFWLDDTGCESLTLKATLILGSTRASKQDELSFNCYE